MFFGGSVTSIDNSIIDSGHAQYSFPCSRHCSGPGLRMVFLLPDSS